MSDNFDPVDSLMREVRGNAEFLERLLFPNIGIILGIVGVLIVVVLLVKLVK
jgi:hypothetical protein